MMPASPGPPPRRRVCVWTCVCASVRARAGRAWAWVLGAAGRRHTCDPFPRVATSVIDVHTANVCESVNPLSSGAIQLCC